MNNSDFEKDPRQKINRAMMPYMENIYRRIWGEDIIIERIEKMADYVLDRKFAIDIIITFPNGMILTGQEKCLTTNYFTLTVEYEQNQFTGEHGDWFNLAAQFYFCGYTNPKLDGFRKWIIVDWGKLAIDTNVIGIKWHGNANNKTLASFKYLKFTDIPDKYILAKENI